MLHVFQDGSTLKKITANELVNIQVWRGNRFIDLEHAASIKSAIGDEIQTLDSSIFRTVTYRDGVVTQRFLVDGQHRQHVIKTYYEETRILPVRFDVLIIEKAVDSEAEAIEYFNTVNNVKPQRDEDTRALANKYIVALSAEYKKLIRPEGKATKRPFLSSDQLRKKLEENSDLLKQSDDNVRRFVQNVVSWNKRKLAEFEVCCLGVKSRDKGILDSCTEKRFMLAYDVGLPWLRECLV